MSRMASVISLMRARLGGSEACVRYLLPRFLSFGAGCVIVLMFAPPNMLLFLVSRLVSLPEHHTTVPGANASAYRCRIYQDAMSQESCGACTAFAVSALVAMQACLYDGRDYIPSPYRIFDCAGARCDTAIPFSRAVAIANAGVSDLGDSERRFGGDCDHPRDFGYRRLLELDGVPVFDPLQIKTAILFYGPLMGTAWFPVTRPNDAGVYSLQQGQSPQMHALVVVGWDEASNWIVQNSWGNAWGDGKGRGRVAPDVLRYAMDPSARVIHNMCFFGIAVCVLWMGQHWRKAPEAV